MKNQPKKSLRTMCGTIVGASRIQDFLTRGGQKRQRAMLHVRENADDERSEEVAVKVTGELCHYVGCLGARVRVEYVVRVFPFTKDGFPSLGNDIYATDIRMV